MHHAGVVPVLHPLLVLTGVREGKEVLRVGLGTTIIIALAATVVPSPFPAVHWGGVEEGEGEGEGEKNLHCIDLSHVYMYIHIHEH